ncbi:MAG: LLM class flavin-dependent oxidoreductase [Gammaproteobacteria bacterium]|nr:LLM class flavin-dependent oxidoreductase [Gammaproteobacteria bacterium]
MEFGAMLLLSRPQGRSQADVYRQALEQIEHAEALGFDAVWLAEHHFSPYGQCPSTLTMAAHVAARTRRVRIGTAVIILPFWNPVLVAEEAALVDQLSDGRLDLGIGRGYQWHEFQGFNLSMEESRTRFLESVDIIRKAFVEDRFDYQGEHYRFRDLSVDPKPLQQPHPPIWVAGVSPQTIAWIAENGFYRLSAATKTLEQLKRDDALFQDALRKAGRPPPDKNPLLRIVHVGEDEHSCRADMEEPIRWFFAMQERIVRPPQWDDLPDQYAYYRRAFSKLGNIDYDFATRHQMLVGSAEDVTRRLIDLHDGLGFNHLMCQFALGMLSHEKTMQSMERFARDVMPVLRQRHAQTREADATNAAS